MKSKLLHITLLAALAILVASCYTNRYIPDGSYRLDETEQTVEMADGSEATPEVNEALKNSGNYYVQRRNAKVFSLRWLPVGMWLYSIAKPTDSSFWGNYWRRLGEAPVIYDEEKSVRTAKQLQELLQSKGCFNSTVSFDTLNTDGKKITIGYHLTASPRFIIDEVNYHTESNAVRRLLDQWKEGSALKAGTYYDQEILASERTRLVSLLLEKGYYRASTEDITFVVDTTYLDQHLTIDVNVDSRNLSVYHINNIFIYPNSTAGLRSNESAFETSIAPFYDNRGRSIEFMLVKEKGKKMTIDSTTLFRAMMMFPGMTYRPSHITNTYNSLLNLRNFKYINIEFTESPFSSDSVPLVDAHVRLINTTQQKLSVSLELTNASPMGATDTAGNFFTAGNLGIETALEYQHKNIFGGAEILKAKGSLLLELPKFILGGNSGSFYDNFSTFEINLDASLDIPEAFPFSDFFRLQNTRPHTLINVGGAYQYRYWFERILANTSYGYTWTTRPGSSRDITSHRTASHQLLPIELTFVRILNLDADFALRLINVNDLRIYYQYSDHFIFDARYDFNYTNQRFGTRKNFSVFHLSLESAGNLLSLLSHMVDGNSDSNSIREFFGVPFSQYVRLGGEYTYYLYHGKRNTLVSRILLGIGIPYGNSMDMPYEKSFFGGGSTTIRAWPLRRLGPGSYDGSTLMIDRVGDLQFVFNLEERFPIAGIFEGALFTDLGNIWLYNSSDLYPGGELKWDKFLKEIAVGVGLGVRVNVSIATLRLDFAIPLYDPGFEESLRWRPPHWKFNQIVTSFGINYPF